MYVQTAITVFNKRLGADRREVYFPTCIRSASFLENKSSGHSTDGAHSQSLAYKLRIPANATVQNGVSQQVHIGDVVLVPPQTPHWPKHRQPSPILPKWMR